ncbi:MAG: response regulator, partial [Deltaproteobacteria bacterium]|nr:response regulator [Deltaproteobacteria bacterium]
MTTEPTNILIVDDREENLVAIEAALADPAYRIVTARSGPEALSCLLRNDFAVVVLDVMMPGMDGYEVATLMKERERTRHVPILFLTALATDISHIFKGYSAGAVDYLTKPIEPEIIRAKVAVFADLYRAERRLVSQGERLREVERRESEAWFSTTLRSIADAVIATDVRGRVRFLNPLAEQLTGWSQA